MASFSDEGIQVEKGANQGAASAADSPSKDQTEYQEAIQQAKQWLDGSAKGRSPVVVTAGKSGVGKSTMINNFLELEGSDACPTGDDAGPTTTDVMVCQKTRHGIQLTLIDTPGFGDLDSDTTTILKELSTKTQQKADVLLYCASLHPTSRFNATDVEIIKAFDNAYGSEIWKRTILILTFANERSSKSEDDYKKLIDGYASRFYDVLFKADICENIQVKSIFAGDVEVGKIPAIPIGENATNNRLKCGQNWSDLLLVEILKRSDPTAAIQLLKWKGLLSLMSAEAAAELTGSIMIGAAAGAAVSTAVGAPFALIGIIPALAAGIPIGAAAGGVVWLGKHGILSLSHLRRKQREKQYAQSKQKKVEDQKKGGSEKKDENTKKKESKESENSHETATTEEDHDND